MNDLITQVSDPAQENEKGQVQVEKVEIKSGTVAEEELVHAKKKSIFLRLFSCGCISNDKKSESIPMKSGLNSKGKKKTTKRILLPALALEDTGKKCLVLDLDETLVHSSFKPVPNPDFIVPVEIDNQSHSVYVLKRPGVDEFIARLAPQFEIVLFTASLAKYADPLLDILDKSKVMKHRLFRDSCLHHKGSYVKDLSQLGRNIKEIIIIDNAPVSYMFHPSNAIPITSWFNDPNDTELLDLIPFLEDLNMVDDVTTVLDQSE